MVEQFAGMTEPVDRIGELAAETDSLQRQLSLTEHRLASLEASLSARVASVCDRLENRLAPVGTRRRRITATLRTGMAVLFTEGAGTFAAVFGRWLRGERGCWMERVGRRDPGSTSGENPHPSSSPFARPAISEPALRAFSLREEPGDAELLRQARAAKRWAIRPGFDLVSYSDGASTSDLEATFASLRQQTYEGWTWHVELTEEGRAVVSALAARNDRVEGFNASAQSAGGVPGRRDFVVPLRPGDLLSPDALYAVADEIRLHPEAALVFGDEDRLDGEGSREKPFFKPDWSPELALSVNLMDGMAAFRRSRISASDGIESLGGGLSEWEDSLRIGRECGEIRHVPRILCHRKARQEAARPDAVVSMLARNLERSGVSCPEVIVAGLRGRSFPRFRWTPAGDRLVSIIVPSRTPALAALCLQSLLGRRESVRIQVIVVTTGGRPESWNSLRETLADPRVEFLRFEPEGGAFNFHRACHAGRGRARGEALLFLNDDVLIGQDDWLSRLLQWLDLEGVGAVGPKLLFPDGRIQHAGAVLGMTGFAAHVFRGEAEGTPTCFVSDDSYRNCSALTAACLLVRSDAFDRAGGFDERFTLLFGDVDLCLRLRRAGWRLVYTPDVRLVHGESSTRRGLPADSIPRSDWELLTRLWLPALASGDPFYNPNLTVREERPNIRRGPDDTPIDLNEELMQRLPRKALITFPEDLFGVPLGGRPQ